VEYQADNWGGQAAYEMAKLRHDNSEWKWTNIPIKPSAKVCVDERNMFGECPLSHSELQLTLLGADSIHSVGSDVPFIKFGDIIDKIYYLDSGELSIDGLSASGDRRLVCNLMKNNLFGLEALLQNPNRTFKSPFWISNET